MRSARVAVALAALASLASVGSRAAADPVAPERHPVAAPRVEVWYRYTSLSLPGTAGATHAVGVALLPLRTSTEMRWLRWTTGMEAAFRAGPNGHRDVFGMALTSVGVQYPGRVVAPFVAGVASGGFVVEQRFGRDVSRFAYGVGAEAGADLRLVGPLGLGLAVGVGRTVEGNIYHDAAWLRVIVPVF